MPVVKPLTLRHTVQLALAGGLEVGDPVVVFPLEQLGVELSALLLPEVPGAPWTGGQVAAGKPEMKYQCV